MDMVIAVRQFDIVLVNLDPTVGSEIRKTRPCVVVSPNEMNQYLRTLIVAPMTTTVRGYPSRVPIRFQGKAGQVALDHLRSVDRSRLVRRIGAARPETARVVSATLIEMFRPSSET